MTENSFEKSSGLNLSFSLWKSALKTAFSWNLWKKLIIISAIPILINTLVWSIFASDIITSAPLIISGSSESFPFFAILKFLFAFLFAIEIGILILATLHITTRDFFSGKENSVVTNLFERATQIFIPFHLYLARMVWYNIIPLLVGTVALLAVNILSIPVVGSIIPLPIIIVTIWRMCRSAFAIPFYFENEGKNRKEIFESALAFTKDKTLSIFFSLVGLSTVTFILSICIGFAIGLLIIINPEDPSLFSTLALSLPSVLFEGITTVFFYIIYKLQK